MSHRHRGYVGAVLGGVLAAALLAACANVGTSPRDPARGLVPSTGTVLDQKLPSELESLHLVDQRGRTFTLASLRGKTAVLADFLTLCQEVCPLTSVNLRDVVTAVAHRGLGGQVVVVEATVDPKRDTAARLAAYARLYGHHDGWILATGDPLALDTLWSRLGVYHAVDEEGVGPAARDWWTGARLTYDVDHQDIVYIVDSSGHLRWEDNGTPNTMGERPPGTMDRFLSSEGRQNLTAPAEPTWTARDIENALAFVTGKKLA